MDKEPIKELEDIGDVKEEEDRLVWNSHMLIIDAENEIKALHNVIKKISERVLRDDVSITEKKEVLYRSLTAIFRAAIGYSLSIDAAIAVTEAVLEDFRHTKQYMDHEKEEKIDRKAKEVKLSRRYEPF